MDDPKFREGQEVYCKVNSEYMFIGEVGESMYFCVSIPGGRTGWYYFEAELEEVIGYEKIYQKNS